MHVMNISLSTFFFKLKSRLLFQNNLLPTNNRVCIPSVCEQKERPHGLLQWDPIEGRHLHGYIPGQYLLQNSSRRRQ